MSGPFADRLPFRRAPLAFALCLLAFLFAVEAKTAIYGPLHGPGSDVRAAKALPAVTPKLLKQRVLLPDPLYRHAPLSALPLLAAMTFHAAHLPPATGVLCSQPPLIWAAILSPQHFFRPPPAL